jgi:hypothetical protein
MCNVHKGDATVTFCGAASCDIGRVLVFVKETTGLIGTVYRKVGEAD